MCAALVQIHVQSLACLSTKIMYFFINIPLKQKNRI